MTRDLALLDPNLEAVIEYPLNSDRLWQLTGHLNAQNASVETLGAFNIVPVEESPPPAVAFGEALAEPVVVNDDGTWRQQWTKTRITLQEAQQQLGRMVIEIYWRKMLAAPTIAEFQAAGMSFIPVIQARQIRWNDDVADVAARIQGAGNIDAAHAIYLELEAMA